MLKFMAWIDQAEADYLKARSAAIRATKMAVEAAGFALPEPIYRLRTEQAPKGPLANTAAAAPGRATRQEAAS